VAQLDRAAGIPAWALVGEVWNVTRTADELSVVTRENAVPHAMKAERGWRALKLVGPFSFAFTGILASVLNPLSEAGVGIFAFSTFDTDYVMVKDEKLEAALTALEAAGHDIEEQEG
jgi:hypothetical protein